MRGFFRGVGVGGTGVWDELGNLSFWFCDGRVLNGKVGVL